MNDDLMFTAKDAFALSPEDAILFHGTVEVRRQLGLWRYPLPTSGDFETMTLRDKIYWLYKAQYPVMHAVRGSGLEEFFAAQTGLDGSLPPGFEAESELSLSCAGDLMDHPYLAGSGGALYAGIEDLLFGADVSTANLECLVTPDVQAFTIRPTEAPPLAYRPGGFDVVKGTAARCYMFVSAASNHSLDCGEAGVVATRRALAVAGIDFHGINEHEEEADRATVVERRGVRVGMLSHAFGLNGKKPPPNKSWMVNRTTLNGRVGEIDLSLMRRQIQWCRDHEVDLIVGHLHWGLEHEYYPRPEQLLMAHELAELGLDIVIGHHPHVLQPMEHYRTRRDPERVVPIYYSLGNLVNPFTHAAFRLGGIARITVAKGRTADGNARTYVREAGCATVFQEIDRERKRLRLVPADEVLPADLFVPPHLRA
jgi:poly-gamma-glutamate synthesis protein (capsule biosynthesis protein)